MTCAISLTAIRANGWKPYSSIRWSGRWGSCRTFWAPFVTSVRLAIKRDPWHTALYALGLSRHVVGQMAETPGVCRLQLVDTAYNHRCQRTVPNALPPLRSSTLVLRACSGLPDAREFDFPREDLPPTFTTSGHARTMPKPVPFPWERLDGRLLCTRRSDLQNAASLYPLLCEHAGAWTSTCPQPRWRLNEQEEANCGKYLSSVMPRSFLSSCSFRRTVAEDSLDVQARHASAKQRIEVAAVLQGPEPTRTQEDVHQPLQGRDGLRHRPRSGRRSESGREVFSRKVNSRGIWQT